MTTLPELLQALANMKADLLSVKLPDDASWIRPLQKEWIADAQMTIRCDLCTIPIKRFDVYVDGSRRTLHCPHCGTSMNLRIEEGK